MLHLSYDWFHIVCYFFLCGYCPLGIGISTDKFSTLFEPFHCVDHSLARLNSGVGLGLCMHELLKISTTRYIYIYLIFTTLILHYNDIVVCSAIASRLAQSIDGEVTLVKSQLGLGTTFLFSVLCVSHSQFNEGLHLMRVCLRRPILSCVSLMKYSK